RCSQCPQTCPQDCSQIEVYLFDTVLSAGETPFTSASTNHSMQYGRRVQHLFCGRNLIQKSLRCDGFFSFLGSDRRNRKTCGSRLLRWKKSHHFFALPLCKIPELADSLSAKFGVTTVITPVTTLHKFCCSVTEMTRV